jgi:hypothetical protein
MNRLHLCLTLALCWPLCARPDEPVLRLWEERYLTVRAGATVHMVLHASVREGYVVVAQPDKRGKLLPLSLKMEPPEQLKLGSPVYPDAEPAKLQGGAIDAQVYRGTIAIRLPVTAPAKVDPGPHGVKGLLQYQGCDAVRCQPPMAIPIELTITIRQKPLD